MNFFHIYKNVLKKNHQLNISETSKSTSKMFREKYRDFSKVEKEKKQQYG